MILKLYPACSFQGVGEMTANMGTFDRIMRLILAVVLIAAPFVSGFVETSPRWMVYASIAIGIVMLVTSLTRVCPVYSIFGIRTCKAK